MIQSPAQAAAAKASGVARLMSGRAPRPRKILGDAAARFCAEPSGSEREPKRYWIGVELCGKRTPPYVMSRRVLLPESPGGVLAPGPGGKRVRSPRRATRSERARVVLSEIRDTPADAQRRDTHTLPQPRLIAAPTGALCAAAHHGIGHVLQGRVTLLPDGPRRREHPMSRHGSSAAEVRRRLRRNLELLSRSPTLTKQVD